MIKKLLFSILLTMFSMLLFAKPVSESTAKQVGANFLSTKTSLPTNVSELTLVYTMTNHTQTIPYFYVFNIENKGFIIVSGDDTVLPVLGYSDEGIFVTENIALQVAKWLENYKEQIRYIVENNIPATTEIQAEWEELQKDRTLLKTQQSAYSTFSTQAVSPLVQTKWNQAPYVNAQCPYDNSYNELTVTGCVATAMAQIMKYWNYPAQGSGFHSYNHPTYGTLSANFGATTYNWNAMPNYVNSANSAVATLMYHCGVGVEMNYGVSATGGSGSYVIIDYSPTPQQTAEYAFKTYFDYDNTTLQGVLRSNYSDTNWINLLKNELDASRPIQYAGFGSGGHTWVMDGYDNNNFFHMNWGWGGSQDGYFQLNALNPGAGGIGGGGYTFNNDQQALIGIQPADAGTVPQNYDLRLFSSLNMSDDFIWFGSDFSLSVDIGNWGTGNFTGQLGAAVFDDNYNFIDFMEIENTTLQGGYYDEFTFENVSSTLFVPGTYHVAVFYKTDTQDWTIVSDGDYYNLYEFVIYYSSDIETYSDFTITTNNGILSQGQSATINVDITNVGSSTFYGSYRLLLSNPDGSPAQDIQILSENDGLQSNYHYSNGLDFTGIISVEPGTYLLVIAYQEQGSSNWYYVGSSYYQNPVFVTVQALPYQPDPYENNNIFEDSYVFTPSFSGNTASVKTTASNIHVGNDNDFYKVNLPSGYDYTITARLQDSWDSNDGNTYSVDALFSYSTDNGVTWSDFYDTMISNNIVIQNSGNVVFHVAPYFEGFTGTYLLDIDINRQTLGTQDFDAENQIKVYPNPAKEYVFVDISAFSNEVNEIKINNVQGQVIRTIKVGNETLVQIPLQNLANGVYFAQIHSAKGISTKKIIVQ
ncbi:MAG: thiol protease/hemagglutinin PrtT [Flavobacteriaceae bacterium]